MFFSRDLLFLKLSILSLAFGCMLNLNGVGVMVIGINQIYSPILLLACFILIGKGMFQHASLSNELLLYIFSVFIYLIVGGFVGLLANEFYMEQGQIPVLFLRYIAALIVVIAAYYSVIFTSAMNIEPMKILLILCITASFFIPFGEYLNISGKIIVDNQRGSGLFGNPNEAGIITAVGFSLVLNIIQKRWLKIILLCFFILMALLTFSKTSLIMLVLVYFLNLLIKGNYSMAVARIIISLTVVYVLLSFFKLDIINQFESNQAKRVEQTLDIILLTPSDDILESSRGYLWRQGKDKIAKKPILGNGLGSLHSMQGASISVNNKVSQGVHNTYLLKIGEAGIIGLAVFVGFIVITGYRSFSLSKNNIAARFCFLYLIIFSIDCISSHNVELLRFHNYLLGFSLAMLAIAKQDIRRERLCAD